MSSKPVSDTRTRFQRGGVEYRGHQIRAKKDFADFVGYHRGFYFSEAYVVLKDGINVMPGACYFSNVADAEMAIDIKLDVSPDRFWETVRAVQEAQRNAAILVIEQARQQSKAPEPKNEVIDNDASPEAPALSM
ncbi:hypothetical protein [Bosea sp. RAC05]|mgnify:CR=1 FL=1|uniref:hypothetical protein n=1 Tax=Bosea sp. RAC05 TaxID=1842539 RepID=UPI00083D2D8A|nr:hypothetical protein [Bosea sp. RAC05]AOG03335.1 hypothetical protein BSY19_5262 [Bosea sp. RAC05]